MMNAQEISDKTHEMNPRSYKNAQVILEAYNQEVLHETVLNFMNVLYYNAAWDFKTETNTDPGGITWTVISCRYNGTITALSSLNKMRISKKVTMKMKF